MNKKNEPLTIGQLAKIIGMNPSALRYYEEQGLLEPAGRSEAGYRLYAPEAIQTLRFIQRGQHLGLSLEDIRKLLVGRQNNNLDLETVLQIVQTRYLTLESQMTQLLVQQHELGLLLQDLENQVSQRATPQVEEVFKDLLDRVCTNPINLPNQDTFEWLLAQTGCILNSDEGRRLIDRLRGQHVHVWQEAEGYHILIVSQDATVGEAVKALAELESHCEVHVQTPFIATSDHNGEGFLLVVQGAAAFIYVRLFLMLEMMK